MLEENDAELAGLVALADRIKRASAIETAWRKEEAKKAGSGRVTHAQSMGSRAVVHI